MPTTYTVPGSPADPEAAALELIVRIPVAMIDDIPDLAGSILQ